MPLMANKSVQEGAAGLVYACLCPVASLKDESTRGVPGGSFLGGTHVALAHRMARDQGVIMYAFECMYVHVCVCVFVCMCDLCICAHVYT